VSGNFREDILNAWFYEHRDTENSGMKRGVVAVFEDTPVSYLMENSESPTCSVQSTDSEGMDQERVDQGKMYGQEWDLGVFDNYRESNGHIIVNAMAIDKRDSSSSSSSQNNLGGPKDQDVVLGRGKRVQNHPGNMNFRSFLENYSDEYNKAARNQRRQFCTDLIQILRSEGVRFLKQSSEPGVWMECDSAQVEKKVGQFFRELRKTK